MPLATLIKPKNALGSKDIQRQLLIQKILEFANGKGAIALKGQGGKPIIF